MSLLERYMINRLAEAFGIYDDNVIKRMMLQPGVLQTIDYFFNASLRWKCREQKLWT
jgi:hypothetical protein